MDLDGLLLGAASAEELAGMLVASLRLDLPTVYAPPASRPLCAVLAALGLTPRERGPCCHGCLTYRK